MKRAHPHRQTLETFLDEGGGFHFFSQNIIELIFSLAKFIFRGVLKNTIRTFFDKIRKTGICRKVLTKNAKE